MVTRGRGERLTGIWNATGGTIAPRAVSASRTRNTSSGRRTPDDPDAVVDVVVEMMGAGVSAHGHLARRHVGAAHARDRRFPCRCYWPWMSASVTSRGEGSTVIVISWRGMIRQARARPTRVWPTVGSAAVSLLNGERVAQRGPCRVQLGPGIAERALGTRQLLAGQAERCFQCRRVQTGLLEI